MAISTFSVLVIGSAHIGKSELIRQLAASRQLDCNEATVSSNGAVSDIRFVEVDNEKNDLWMSLTATAYVIMYRADDACSFRNASEVLLNLKRRNHMEDAPVILLANKKSCERKLFTLAKEGKRLAKRYDCKFYELTSSTGMEDIQEFLTKETLRCNSAQKRDSTGSIPSSFYDAIAFSALASQGNADKFSFEERYDAACTSQNSYSRPHSFERQNPWSLRKLSSLFVR